MGNATNIVAGGASVLIGTDLGYIKDGITITPTRELLLPENVETLFAPPKAFLTKETYGFTFTLVEPTEANIIFWLDVGNAIAPGPPAILKVGHGPGGDLTQPTERVLVVTGIVPGGTFVRTITCNRAVADAPGEMKITQFEETALPCSFTIIWDSVNTRAFVISDAAS